MATLNISALAQRTGVAADTLRKWEQRYGILQPTRTAGGQRRYDESDVARVEWLKARLREGYRISEAAALLGDATAPVHATPAELREALLEAVGRADANAIARLLDQAFTVQSLESALVDVVQPTLEAVGARWAEGAFNVAQEHLFSVGVRARLERLLADARGGVRGVAVLACAPGERHELGLMMLAVLLRADGWQVAYLGAETPYADALALAERVGARVLAISAASRERVQELEREARQEKRPPAVELLVGGAGVERADAERLGARYVNRDLKRAVRTMRGLSR